MLALRPLPLALLAAAVAALLAGLAIACSPDSGPAVGRVVMAVAPPRDFSNIRRIPGQDSNWYMRPHYEYLVGFDKTTGAYVPQLATEWSLEPDGHSWRFRLREGVQFNGGHGAFTAEDVRFSWLMNILPDDASTEANTLRTYVLDVEIVNDHEVVFHTNEPYADTFEVISEIQGGMEIASRADFLSRGPGTLARKPSAEWAGYADDPRLAELTGGRDPVAGEPPLAGTAPYTIVSMDEQTGVVYRRAGDHWRDTPDFPEFEFQFIPEASTRLAKLLRGEVHLAKLPEELANEAGEQGFVTFTAQVPATRFFLTWQGVYVPAGANAAEDRVGASGTPALKECAVDPDAAPDDLPFLSCSAYPTSPQTDLRVRKALNRAIDRNAINDAFFDGKGLTMYRNHYLPDNAQRVGWNPEWETRFEDEYGFDQDAARALLADAGYDANNPLRTTMQLTPLAAVPAAIDVQQAIANYWRDVGVEVAEQQVDPTDYIRRQREMHWDNHIFSASSSGAQLLTMLVYGSSIFPSLSIGFQDPATEAIIREAYETNTPQDRDDLLRQAGNLAYDMHQDIPLFWLPNEVVADPDVVEDFIFSGMISGAPIDHLEGLVAR
ncbi:MAG: ABC transporter substrate-binding protein [Chloroflexota bacterium]|nr:ABC transporter substrate-binding protein [Chloroflexota bacterium]MDE2883621.1 ABC transporter substrate-binding protein [Chloroflexota bacterium]